MSEKRAVPPKRRADVLAVEAGLYPSRARAAEEIRAGNLLAGGKRVTKPGQLIDPASPLKLKGMKVPYVSRAGLKLAAALDHFKISVDGKTCLDVGASTGGFTQVLLERGAAKVFAVDVGHGQLAAQIADDPRVISLEGMDARNLTPNEITEAPSIIVADVSFISLTKVLPAALKLAKPGAELVALIKPQFEVGKANIGSGGIVRDAAARDQACAGVAQSITAEGWEVSGLIESPITGGDGNVEFLIGASKR